MTHADAVAFLRPAGPWRGSWIDVGAGEGIFTRALAELLESQGTVLAIDRDERALTALRRSIPTGVDGHAQVRVARGDMHDLSAIAELHSVDPIRIDALQGAAFDGALFANVLHFTKKQDTVLAQIAERLRDDGRIVVVEYDRRWPNPWVPHPLPLDRLEDVAKRAGLGAPTEVARRPSAYQRELYCALLTR